MNNNKEIKKAKRMQTMVNLMMRLKNKSKAEVRVIKTNHGDVRVLEYGFDNKKVQPLFIDMHGGGFVLMTAESDDDINMYLRERCDVKIISIDYPKAPDHPFPAALEAIETVIEFYIKEADTLNIDCSTLGIGGHSAGANLAASVCMRAQTTHSFEIAYQILDYPPMDLFTNPYNKPRPKGAISPKMAHMFNTAYVSEADAKNPYASPVYASKDMLKNMPPTLILVAGRDSLHDEGVQFADMLIEAGVNVNLHEFPEAEHGFTLKKSEDTTQALELMVDFINGFTRNNGQNGA